MRNETNSQTVSLYRFGVPKYLQTDLHKIEHPGNLGEEYLIQTLLNTTVPKEVIISSKEDLKIFQTALENIIVQHENGDNIHLPKIQLTFNTNSPAIKNSQLVKWIEKSGTTLLFNRIIPPEEIFLIKGVNFCQLTKSLNSKENKDQEQIELLMDGPQNFGSVADFLNKHLEINQKYRHLIGEKELYEENKKIEETQKELNNGIYYKPYEEKTKREKTIAMFLLADLTINSSDGFEKDLERILLLLGLSGSNVGAFLGKVYFDLATILRDREGLSVWERTILQKAFLFLEEAVDQNHNLIQEKIEEDCKILTEGIQTFQLLNEGQIKETIETLKTLEAKSLINLFPNLELVESIFFLEKELTSGLKVNSGSTQEQLIEKKYQKQEQEENKKIKQEREAARDRFAKIVYRECFETAKPGEPYYNPKELETWKRIERDIPSWNNYLKKENWIDWRSYFKKTIKEYEKTPRAFVELVIKFAQLNYKEESNSIIQPEEFLDFLLTMDEEEKDFASRQIQNLEERQRKLFEHATQSLRGFTFESWEEMKGNCKLLYNSFYEQQKKDGQISSRAEQEIFLKRMHQLFQSPIDYQCNQQYLEDEKQQETQEDEKQDYKPITENTIHQLSFQCGEEIVQAIFNKEIPAEEVMNFIPFELLEALQISEKSIEALRKQMNLKDGTTKETVPTSGNEYFMQ